jgi:hypothetical protein
MDDNIIRHYSNEATFVIHILRTSCDAEQRIIFEITLSELDDDATTSS